ncbi:MAG: MotA/TolQ/ExbB proton channel family protein [Campylobacterota bacterium]|nr:MotA/TolQ/ExbB proton channel family protein [Campylobacterota bacterium]
MNLIELWTTQDWVVKILMLAFFVATIIILEKVYHLIRIHRVINRLDANDLEHVEFELIKEMIDSIASFAQKEQALYNANIGVQLEKFDQYMMRYIGFVGLIAILSPMVGLIGTFFGVWHVFEGVGSFGLNDPGIIARGIKEVLIDTMAGLIVAVYATIGYRLLELWVRQLSVKFEEKLYHYVGFKDAA